MQDIAKDVSLIEDNINEYLQGKLNLVDSIEFGIMHIKSTKDKLDFARVVKVMNRMALSDEGSMADEQAQQYIQLAHAHPEGLQVGEVVQQAEQLSLTLSRKKKNIVDFFVLDLHALGSLIEKFSREGTYFELIAENGVMIY
ncbi:MAG: hypothetical protein ACRC0U_04005, partial [Vibrio sp.]